MSVKLRRKKLADGRESLYLDSYQNGRRQYDFLKLYLGKDRALNKEILKLAHSIRDKRSLDLANSEHGHVAAYRRKINFVDYFEQLTKQRLIAKGPWRNTLNHLRAFTGGTLQISGVSREWLEGFKAYLLSKVSPNTAYTYFSKVKAAMKQAEGKLIDRNPAAGVPQVKQTETERSYLTLEDLETLAATECDDPEVKRAFLFCCFSGLRLCDAESLLGQNIQNDRLQFRQKKTKGFEYVPLSQTAKEILRNEAGNVLPLPTTKIFALRSRSHIMRMVKLWAEAAKIQKPVSFHTSRHTFATLSLTSGVDLYTVSKLLGHKTLASTQVYAKIIDQKKNEAVALLPRLKMRK